MINLKAMNDKINQITCEVVGCVPNKSLHVPCSKMLNPGRRRAEAIRACLTLAGFTLFPRCWTALVNTDRSTRITKGIHAPTLDIKSNTMGWIFITNKFFIVGPGLRSCNSVNQDYKKIWFWVIDNCIFQLQDAFQTQLLNIIGFVQTPF